MADKKKQPTFGKFTYRDDDLDLRDSSCEQVTQRHNRGWRRWWRRWWRRNPGLRAKQLAPAEAPAHRSVPREKPQVVKKDAPRGVTIQPQMLAAQGSPMGRPFRRLPG